MKKIFYIIGGIVVLSIIIAITSSGGEKKEITPEQQIAQEQIEIISYTILREWKPDRDSKAIGMEILVAEEDVSKENIINLVKFIGEDSKKVCIRIFQDKKAWEQEKIDIYGEVYDKGYLAYYIKNLTNSGGYLGFNEIRWMQTDIMNLFGRETKL